MALQKTFAATDLFPGEALRQAGYESVVHTRDGEFQNGWGVAVLIRRTLPKPKILQIGLPGQQDPGARFVTVAVGDLEFSSVYAVYGNPRLNGLNGAMERKIAWMNQLREHVAKRSNLAGRCVLAGDLDVVSEGPALPGTLSQTSRERDALNAVLGLRPFDLYDSHRHRQPNVGTGFNYGLDSTLASPRLGDCTASLERKSLRISSATPRLTWSTGEQSKGFTAVRGPNQLP